MRLLPILALLALASTAHAQHRHDASPPAERGQAPAWTATPMVQARPAGRVEAEIVASNLGTPDLRVISPKGMAQPLAMTGNKARLKPESGNYHLILAESDSDGATIIAATAVYFSNPGPTPADILAAPRPGLTLLPENLPREHANYRSGNNVRFRLMADGQPLPGTPVQLETANGTRQRLNSDLDGWVRVTFPSDFPPLEQRPQSSHGRPLAAPFVLSASLNTGTRPRLTSFAYAYGPAALDGTSPWVGAGFAALGMAFAVPLVLRRRGGAK